MSKAGERIESLSSQLSKGSDVNRENLEHSPFLVGNWEPVSKEIYAENLQTIGRLPQDIAGQFVRNGSNPFFDFTNKPYHVFDGDGMLHGLKIENGKATYINRWVETKRLISDKQHGVSIADIAESTLGNFHKFVNTSDENGERMGKANTSLITHAGKVFALEEQDKPYEIQIPDLKTLGRFDFSGTLDHVVTAHPKVDPKTGEMIFFGYSLNGPYIDYSVADKDGKLIRSIKIDIHGPTMMHDFAITENYSIIFDLPLTYDMQLAFEKKNPWDFDVNKNSRFGILPRHSKDGKDIRWFEFESCYIYHSFNAWEEGDKIYLYACRQRNMTMDVSSVIGYDDNYSTFMHEYVFNLSTGESSERRVFQVQSEFPTIDLTRLGRKNRYFYSVNMAIRPNSTTSFFKTVIKYDRLKNVSYLHTLKDNLLGGEFVFIPNPHRSDSDEDEDNGYLASFAHNEQTNQSEFYLINAKTMDEEPLARVLLPQRVPWGFHGSWFSKSLFHQ